MKKLEKKQVYFCEIQGCLASLKMFARLHHVPFYQLIRYYLEHNHVTYDDEIRLNALAKPNSDTLRALSILSFWSEEFDWMELRDFARILEFVYLYYVTL